MNLKETSVQRMFSQIAPRYDLANAVLSLGLHHYWMRRALAMLPAASELSALDLCTGTGALLPILRKRYQTVVGLDFSREMLKKGQTLRDLQAVDLLVQGDACNLPFKEASFDIITVAYGVRNLVSLNKGLAEFQRVLKPGGYLVVLEFGQPDGVIWSRFFKFYSHFLMPVIGGTLTGNKAAYQYLPETSAAFPCGASFENLMNDAGFTSVATKKLSGGVAYAYLGWRK